MLCERIHSKLAHKGTTKIGHMQIFSKKSNNIFLGKIGIRSSKTTKEAADTASFGYK